MATIARTMPIDDYLRGEGGTAVSFIELSPPMRTLPLAPSFMLGAVSAADNSSMFSITQTGPAGMYVVRDAVVTADGITLHAGTMLTSVLTNFPAAHCEEMIRHVPAAVMAGEPRRLAGASVLMTGPGYTTWGHWLVDFLPRLFLMQRAGWQIDRLNWIIPKQTPLFARELLSLAGLPQDALAEYDPTTETLAVDMLMIPTNLAAGPLLHPLFNEAVAWLKQRMHAVLIGSAARRPGIFLSRSSAAFQRMLGNRDVIETIARAAGYAVVDPALLPVADQLGLFYSATRIVGEYGSGLHTSIFASAGAITVCLRGPHHTAGTLQNGLAKATGQSIAYVFGEAMPDAPIEAYRLNAELFRHALDYAAMVA